MEHNIQHILDNYKKCKKCNIIKLNDMFTKKYASCKECRKDIRQYFNKKYYYLNKVEKEQERLPIECYGD